MHDLRIADIQDVISAVNQGEALVLDTLPPEHFAARHIPGAKNACVYEVTFLDQIKALSSAKDRPIITYGAGEGSLDSRVATVKLIRNRYSNVSCFAAGLKAWKEAGHPLEGTHPDHEDPPHPVLELGTRKYAVLPEESRIVWFGRNFNGGHTGTLAVQDGFLQSADNSLTGHLILDMESIRNLDLAGDEMQPVLEAHLKSDDFFFVQLFPVAEFEVKEMNPIPEAAATLPNYQVRGELTLRGLSHELAFSAHLRPLPEGRIAMMANFDLDRTLWNVIYGSARFFKHLSYHIVYDLISLDVRLVMG